MEITFENYRDAMREMHSILNGTYFTQNLAIAILVLLVIVLVLLIVVVVKVNKISKATKALKTNQEILEKELLKNSKE